MAQGKDESDTPTITVWQAPTTGKSPRPAVVICPGGGYGGLATGHEGKDPAEFLTKLVTVTHPNTNIQFRWEIANEPFSGCEPTPWNTR